MTLTTTCSKFGEPCARLSTKVEVTTRFVRTTMHIGSNGKGPHVDPNYDM